MVESRITQMVDEYATQPSHEFLLAVAAELANVLLRCQHGFLNEIRSANLRPQLVVQILIGHGKQILAASIDELADRCIVSFGGTGAAFGMSNSSLAVGCSNVFGNIGGNGFPAGTVDISWGFDWLADDLRPLPWRAE